MSAAERRCGQGHRGVLQLFLFFGRLARLDRAPCPYRTDHCAGGSRRYLQIMRFLNKLDPFAPTSAADRRARGSAAWGSEPRATNLAPLTRGDAWARPGRSPGTSGERLRVQPGRAMPARGQGLDRPAAASSSARRTGNQEMRRGTASGPGATSRSPRHRAAAQSSSAAASVHSRPGRRLRAGRRPLRRGHERTARPAGAGTPS